MMNTQENIKRELVKYLQKAVRELQKEHVANRDVIPSSELTNSLCYGLEAVFLHGLTSATPDKISSANFWAVLCKHTHRSALSDVDSLSQIKTDIGRCRVWIRLALNGCELESYLRLILADIDTLRTFYETWSFICDVECTDLLLTSIQGLECVRFHLGHNSTVLNDWSNVSLSLAGQLVPGIQPNLSSLDLNGTNSFDDYELSPDDREEVRIMFRNDSSLNISNDRLSEAEDGNSAVKSTFVQPCVASRDDLCISSDRRKDISANNGCNFHADHESAKRILSLGEEKPAHVGTSCRSLSLTDDKTVNGTKMTDEMRDLRFDQIVRENLEKYPLDYDRITSWKEGSSSSGSSLGATFPANDASNAEPDAFWRTLQDDQWNEVEAGSLDGTPVLGNSLPKDSWVGPPPSAPGLSPAAVFSIDLNDRVGNELEASYGTILADYQKSMPQQFKLVTAEGASDLLSNDLDDGIPSRTVAKSDRESVKKPSQSQKVNGAKIEDDWVVIENDCPFAAEPYHIDSGCEHLLSFVTQKVIEKKLADQDYRCQGCSKEIEGRGRCCSFDGHYYCSRCHQKDVFFIPSKILYNWDFRKFSVSVENMKFLKKTYDWPLLNIQELNPELYSISEELRFVRDLRRQSYYLAGYMFHCPSSYAVKYWRVMNARLYYFSHIDNYSVQDLVNVHSGSFRKALKKINESAVKHVQQCGSCRARGFCCEICQNSEVIFPFELRKTAVCEKCKNAYHESCKASLDFACPKCNRIQQRRMTISIDPIDLVMFTHPADMVDLQT